MSKSLMLVILVMLVFVFNNADAATLKQTMEGGVDVTITYPDTVITGRNFSISVLVQNNGWEDKQDIRLAIKTQDNFIASKNDTLNVARLSKDGSYGGTIDFMTNSNAQIGIHYLNAVYSQVLLSNNETPTPPTQKNIAIPIELKTQPEIQINTITPSAIFPNAEFSFDVEIVSKDTDLKDVLVEIQAPNDITFRGKTAHTFSSLQKNTPLTIHSQIITGQVDVTSEHKMPFEVIVKYTDDSKMEKTTSKIVPLLLRPRTFMEFTTDGGVWIGSLFLAPYVSLGTLVGIPAGTLFSLVIRRLQKKKTGKKRKSK
jgi:hypothetical protein